MRYGWLPITAAAVLVLTSCTTADDDPVSASSSPDMQSSTMASSASADGGASSSAAPAPATSAGSSSPSGSASTSESASPSESATTAPLTLYYVATGDNGVSGAKIGCGDSLVATYTEPVAFTDQLRKSMERLLSDENQFLGQSGLLNALYMSDLDFVAGAVKGDVVTVELTGQVTLGGVCDAPRVSEQLHQTAETATGAGSSAVLVDGVPLEDLISQK